MSRVGWYNLKNKNMMKKKSLLMVVLMIIVTTTLMSCTDSTVFTIKGESKDFVDGKNVYFATIVDQEVKIIDSTIVRNNSFTIKGKTEKPFIAKIGILNSLEDNKGVIIDFFVESGNIVLGDIEKEKSNKRKVTGTPLNDKLTQFYEKEYLINSNNTLTNEENYERVFELVASYINENIDNELGLFLFERYEFSMPKDMKLDLINNMPTEYKVQYEDLYKETMVELEKQIQLVETAKKMQIGSSYINIKGKDADGKSIALSDFIGKGNYVLIDMWASWCPPCKAEVPFIAENYREFKDKGLSVVGIFVSDEYENLAPSMKELNITWPQIMAETPVLDDYGINGIPELILFSPDGTIVERGVMLRGENLNHTLKKYLKIN